MPHLFDDPRYVYLDRAAPFPGRQPIPRMRHNLTERDLDPSNLMTALRCMDPGDSFQIDRWSPDAVRQMIYRQVEPHVFAVAAFGDGYRCWKFQR